MSRLEGERSFHRLVEGEAVETEHERTVDYDVPILDHTSEADELKFIDLVTTEPPTIMVEVVAESRVDGKIFHR